MDVLKDIQDWYLSNCDENWEHDYGVKVDTLDNPGLSVVIDLIGTSLEISSFQEINHKSSENDWYQCKVENDQFIGYGAPENYLFSYNHSLIGQSPRWDGLNRLCTRRQKTKTYGFGIHLTKKSRMRSAKSMIASRTG